MTMQNDRTRVGKISAAMIQGRFQPMDWADVSISRWSNTDNRVTHISSTENVDECSS